MTAITWELHEMDCRLAMSMLMDANSVDSIVCDPPYGLSKEPDMTEVMRHWLNGDDYEHGGSGFMGKSWDSFVPGPAVWREAYRVLKPGGHLVAFFGTRTYDLGVLALRLAGFEVRDQLAWVFGSGFPKSHDVSKGIDKAAGAERQIISAVAASIGDGTVYGVGHLGVLTSNDPITPEAARWSGWGTALKPAFEPVVLCRKPLSEPTVAANVLRWGAGALNIDGGRIGNGESRPMLSGGMARKSAPVYGSFANTEIMAFETTQGRWPANLATDGSDEATAGFPVSKEGSAARYFYAAKASKSDRNEGLDDLPERASAASEFRPNHTEGAANGEDGNPYGRWSPVRNSHPTVKPTALMQWLVRMVTPPGGLVLDPFTGSGSTGKAAVREGFSFVGCEMTAEYAEIARLRIDHAVRNR